MGNGSVRLWLTIGHEVVEAAARAWNEADVVARSDDVAAAISRPDGLDDEDIGKAQRGAGRDRIDPERPSITVCERVRPGDVKSIVPLERHASLRDAGGSACEFGDVSRRSGRRRGAAGHHSETYCETTLHVRHLGQFRRGNHRFVKKWRPVDRPPPSQAQARMNSRLRA